MNLKVEILPKYRIAYVRQVGPYGPGNIQAMENTIIKWIIPFAKVNFPAENM